MYFINVQTWEKKNQKKKPDVPCELKAELNTEVCVAIPFKTLLLNITINNIIIIIVN